MRGKERADRDSRSEANSREYLAGNERATYATNVAEVR
jgi:hypothetical protein